MDGFTILKILGGIGLLLMIHDWFRSRKDYLFGDGPFLEYDEDGFVTEESRKSHIYIKNGVLHSRIMQTKKFHDTLEACKKIRIEHHK